MSIFAQIVIIRRIYTMEKLQIDDLDRKILGILQEDARTPYLDSRSGLNS